MDKRPEHSYIFCSADLETKLHATFKLAMVNVKNLKSIKTLKFKFEQQMLRKV